MRASGASSTPVMSSDAPPDVKIREALDDIEAYYTAKISTYGPNAHGVDWASASSQELRFAQLLKMCDFSGPFSLNDVGCGYGALLSYLAKFRPGVEIDYFGIDLSAAMIESAIRRTPGRGRANFVVASASPRLADYSVASGIFNVKLGAPLDLWEGFISKTLRDMHATSRKGFAVNFKAAPGSACALPSGLYVTRPEAWVRYCERQLGSSVELVAGYGLDEFTLLIRV